MTDDVRKALRRSYDAYVRNGVAPPLLEAGFTRKGKSFFKEKEAHCLIVSVAQKNYPDEKRVEIDAEAGVYVYGAWQVFDPDFPDVPEISAAQINTDIFSVVEPAERERCWTLRADDPPEKLQRNIEVVRKFIGVHLLPWLEQFRNVRDVADYLCDPDVGPGRTRISYKKVPQSHMDLRHAAACCFLLGDYAKAVEIMALSLDAIDVTVYREFGPIFEDRKNRLVRLIEQERAGG